ncbi:MAG TPA: hypothetical protein VGV60_10530 [Candidatus Polarisedimenticolia bacterium]|jgi:hypothetical protein|nr:hypothetical protein [Candidatus Polarisedimenticolia bacterium]
MRTVRINPILLAAALAFSLASPLCADQVVYFINGKAIMVKSVEKGDKFTVLEMDGGGKMGVPTDQIARIEEYVLSTPAAPPVVPQAAPPVALQASPAPAPAAVPAPAAAQPFITSDGRINGMPANQPLAAPTVPGPGMGGRPTEAPGKGMAGLQPLNLPGGAVPPPGFQRPVPPANAGPAMGGTAAFRGNNAARPNLNPAGRRFAGRPGMQGRGTGRPPDVNRYMPPTTAAPAQNQPPGQGQQPAHPQAPPPNPSPPAEEDPPAATEPETESPPPADPENETSEPETPPPAQGETPEDSGGGAS